MKKTKIIIISLLSTLLLSACNTEYIKNKTYELTNGKSITLDLDEINPFSNDTEQIFEPNEDIFSGSEYQYYYSCLSEEDQLVYRQIYSIFKDRLSNVELSTKDAEKAGLILQYVILDNPSIFYVESSEYTKTSNKSGDVLKLEFSAICSMSESEIQTAQSGIDSFVNGFAYHVSDTMTDYEKALTAYTYIIKNTDYVPDSPHNQNIYSIVLGQSVCQGYALMFKYLCDQMNIPCIVVTGMAGNESHAWNLVYLDNAWSYVDPTFGDNQYLNSDISYSWFGIPCDLMQQNRTINYLELLPSDNTIENDYYYRNGMNFDSYSLSSIQDIAMGGGIFSFKFSNEAAYNTAVDALFTQNDVSRLIVGNSGADVAYITDEESRTVYIKIDNK